MHPMVDARQSRFLDEEMPLLGDRACGRTTQNSHRRLLELVGAWPGVSKPLDDGTRADRTPPGWRCSTRPRTATARCPSRCACGPRSATRGASTRSS